MKYEKGITLIALIITVIILLILAGTAISISMNGGSLFSKTENAKDSWNIGVKEEEITINDYIVYAEDLTLPAWDGTIGTSFAGGTGTEADPYTIENGNQLAYLAKTVNEGEKYENEYISISQSVNLGMIEFTPIGNGITEKDFNGTIDGNGNIITGININLENTRYAGLIGFLGTNGIVKDLKIGNGKINGFNYAGGIVGLNKGLITNCSNQAIVSTDTYQAGGIVGSLVTGKIINCSNSGKIIAKLSNAGGIAGATDDGTIDNCYNNGEIVAGSQAGGIVGALQKATIKKCTNTGKIMTTSGNLAGGIVSYMVSGKVDGCNNTGTIFAEVSNAGGIAGRLVAGSINDCSNSGEVSVNNYWAGGIVGASNDYEKTITNVYNAGNISSKNNFVAGGIVGHWVSGIIENAYNRGKVEGGIIGGICGSKKGGEFSKTYYFTSDNTLKGVGSSSSTEKIEVEDVTGQFERTTKQFNSKAEFLNGIGQ